MKAIVLTTSWDDGHRSDVRLARMLSEYGLKATFYISPRNHEFSGEDLLTPQEIRDLSSEFEIGAHTLTHPRLPTISEVEAEREVTGSKNVLEQITGCAVDAFCYPYGSYNELHVQLVKAAGYRYARTVTRYRFDLNDPYEAGTSLHIYNYGFGLEPWRTARFVNFRPTKTWRCLEWQALGRSMFEHVLAEGGIFHIWGHSWEIDNNNDWERLRGLFEYVSGHPGVRYATNGELVG